MLGTKRWLLSSLMTLGLLAACGGSGGGGGSDNPAGGGTPSGQTPDSAAAGPARGAFAGTMTAPGETAAFQAVLLPDTREVYALYGESTSFGFEVWGYLYGQETEGSGNGVYKAVGSDPWYEPLAAVTIDGHYVNGQSFTGTASSTDLGTVTFDGKPIATTIYNFDQAADLSAISGNWPLADADEGSAVDIAANGQLSGQVDGCAFTGQVTASPSYNVYRVSLAFGAANCILANDSASGIAVVTRLANGKQQLIVAAHDRSAKIGSVVFSTR